MADAEALRQAVAAQRGRASAMRETARHQQTTNARRLSEETTALLRYCRARLLSDHPEPTRVRRDGDG
jgi:hypothetical protein